MTPSQQVADYEIRVDVPGEPIQYVGIDTDIVGGKLVIEREGRTTVNSEGVCDWCNAMPTDPDRTRWVVIDGRFTCPDCIRDTLGSWRAGESDGDYKVSGYAERVMRQLIDPDLCKSCNRSLFGAPLVLAVSRGDIDEQFCIDCTDAYERRRDEVWAQ